MKSQSKFRIEPPPIPFAIVLMLFFITSNGMHSSDNCLTNLSESNCNFSDQFISEPSRLSTSFFYMLVDPTCGEFFYDSGGPNASYGNYENITTVICPSDPNDIVSVNFSSFAVESPPDHLYCYDGSTSNDPLIWSHNGSNLPPVNPAVSSIAGGCLTFVFTSDYNATWVGWEAEVLCAQCADPSNLSTSNEGTNGANLNWTENGSSAVWDIEIGEKPYTPTGTPTIDNVTSNPYTWTGGDGGKIYEFYVRSDCASGGGQDMSNWTGPIEFTTLCPPTQDLPYFIDFDYHINCWTIENVDNDYSGNGDENTWKNINAGSCAGGLYTDHSLVAYYYYGSPNVMDDWAFSPAFYLSDDTTYQLSFSYGNAGTVPPHFEESMEVFILDNNNSTAAATGQQIFDESSIINANCLFEIQNITVATTGIYHIGFHGYTQNNQDKSLAIDNFELIEAPYCEAPIYVQAVDIGVHSVDIVWHDVHGATSYNYEIVPEGAGQGAPGAFTGTIDSTHADNIGALSDSTSYDIYVQAVCSGGPTPWTGPINFITHPEFCGENFYDSGGPNGTYSNYENITTIICPTDSGDIVTVTFLSFISESQGDVLRCYNGQLTSDPLLWNHSGSTIPAMTVSTHPSGCLSFLFTSDYSYNHPGWEAEVICSACKDPDMPGVTNETTTGADLSWVENGTSTIWDIEIGEKPFTPTGTPTIDDVSSNPYTWTGGEGGKIYEFFVRSDCASAGAQDVSNWIGPFEFTTLCDAYESVPYFNDFNYHINCWIIDNVANDYSGNGDENTWKRIHGGGVCSGAGLGDDYTLSAYYYYGSSPAPMNDWAFSPAFDLSADTAYQLSFNYGNAGAIPPYFPESMEVFILEDNNSGAVATGQQIFDHPAIPGFCQIETQFITVPTSGLYYIGFHGYTQNSEDKALNIDDFELKEAPYCEAPNYVEATDIRVHTVDINWFEVFGATSYNYEIVPTGAGQGASGGITGTIDSTHADNIGYLMDSMSYDIFVQGVCSSGPTAWTGPIGFMTHPEFCGEYFYDSGGPNGNYTNNENYTTIICPNDTGDIIVVNFLNFDTEWPNDRLYCNDGNSINNPLIFEQYGFCFPPNPVVSTHESGCLTFSFGSDYSLTNPGWEAEVFCTNCPKPFYMGISNQTVVGADLYWTEVGQATAWDIEIGEYPFTPTGTPSEENLTNTAYTWTGGSSDKVYEYYIRSDCNPSGGTKKSEWVGPYNFSTLGESLHTIPYNNDFDIDALNWTFEDPDGHGHLFKRKPYSEILKNCIWGTPYHNGCYNETSTDYALSVYHDNPNNDGSGGEWAFSPGFELFSDSTYDITIRYSADWSGAKMDMYLSSGNNASTALNGIHLLDKKPIVACDTFNTIFGVDTTGVYYISFFLNGSGFFTTLIINDVSLDYISPCQAPNNLFTTDIRVTTADLHWDALPSSLLSYEWEVVTSGSGHGSTGSITGVLDSAHADNTGPLTELTEYDFYVRTLCVDDTTDWSGPISFTTTEDFCGEYFYDSGGPNGTYANNENSTTVICPSDSGDIVTVNFLSFITEQNSDRLYATDGLPDDGPSLGYFSGYDVPSKIVSTHPSGCLTFSFGSDYSHTQPGWEAEVICSACKDPDSLNVVNETTSGAELSWIENGTSTVWDIEIGEKPYATTGIPGIENVSAIPYTWTGGDGGKIYEFYVRSDCASAGGQDVSNWIGPFEFTTPCEADESLPYFNNFDYHINCWTIENVDNDYSGNGDENTWKRIHGGGVCSGGGSGNDHTLSAYYFYGSPNVMDDWAFSPAFNLSADTTYQLSFNYGNAGAIPPYFPESMEVFILDENNSGAVATGQQIFDNPAIPGFCQIETQNITVPTSGIYYIGFHGYTQNSEDKALNIDDFELKEAPYCEAPINVQTSDIRVTSVDITWTEIHGASSYNWEIVPAGAGQGASGAITGNIDSLHVDNADILTALTDYDIFVQGVCSGGPTAWTGPINFSTHKDFCEAYFYDSGGPNGAYSNNENITTVICPTTVGDTTKVNFLEFHTSGDNLKCFDGPTTNNTLIWQHAGNGLPPVNPVISAHESGCLTFVFYSDYQTTGVGWEAEVFCAYCISPQQLNINNTTSQSSELSWIPGGNCSEDMEYWVLPAPSSSPSVGSGTAIGCSPSFPIFVNGLIGSQLYNVWVYEDCGGGDVAGPVLVGSFTTLSECPPPNSFTVSDIAEFSADISWSPGDSCSTGEEYWVLPAPSFAPSIGSGISSNCTPSFPIVLSALSDSQEYDVWVFVDCDNGYTAGPIKMGSFTTLEACNPIGNFALDFDGVDDYGSFPHISSLLIGSDPYTLETWFKAPDQNQLGTLILKRLASAPYTNVGFSINDGTNPRYTPISGKKISFYFGHAEVGANFRCVTTIDDVVDGLYHHLAAVVDPAQNSVVLYIDGNIVPTNLISTGSMPVVNITNQYTIGDNNGGSSFYSGTIDEVRIWNVVRSQSEIQNNMNVQLIGSETGLVAYYPMNDGTPSSIATDLIVANNCTLVNMLQTEDWICGKPGLAPLNCPPPMNFQPTNITETTAEISWTPGDSCSIGEEYWVLPAPSFAPSIGSGTATSCTPSFPIALSALTDNQAYDVWAYVDCNSENMAGPFKIGSFSTLEACSPIGNFALDFDGVDDYGHFPHTPSLLIGSDPYTLEAWFKAPDQNQLGTIIIKRQPSFPYPSVGFYTNDGSNPRYVPLAGKKITFSIGNGSTPGYRGVTTLDDIVDGDFHHLTAVVDPGLGTVVLYVDGLAVPVNEIIDGAFPVFNVTEQYSIGQNNSGGSFFEGAIDEVRIWNIARSQSEIQNNMNVELSGLEAGLVAYFSMNDGAPSLIATDLVASNHCTLVNMDSTEDWICGKPGMAPNCYQYYYQDSDGDGYGLSNMDSLACPQPVGYSIEKSDCDDTNPKIHPFADELCNGIDDNCDNVLDNPMVPYYDGDTVIITSLTTDSIVSMMTINGAIDPISNVRILNLDISHTRISDLEIRLKSPMGTEIILLSGICENSDDLLINLDNHAQEKVITCPPTTNSFFKPSGDFDNFLGENPNGIWTLTTIDNLSGEGGKLKGWGLDVTRDCACNIVVTTIDSLAGSIIDALNCTSPGDTIIFSSQIFGDTIDLVNYPMIIDQNTSIIGPPFMQINISGKSTQFTVDINDINAIVLFEQLNIISGTGDIGSGIRNMGLLTLDNVNINKHNGINASSLMLNNTPGKIIIRSGGKIIIFD